MGNCTDAVFCSQHQRRRNEHICVQRRYAEKPARDDAGDAGEDRTGWYYSLEVTMHEFFLRSAHRTTDPAEADFFFVPFYSACFQLGAFILMLHVWTIRPTSCFGHRVQSPEPGALRTGSPGSPARPSARRLRRLRAAGVAIPRADAS